MDPKATVLIVDDEPLVRTTIADMLRSGGFHVLEKRRAAHKLCISLANGQPMAAVVSQRRMPGMDGGVGPFLIGVRAIHPEMPIVLVSGDYAPPCCACSPAGTRLRSQATKITAS